MHRARDTTLLALLLAAAILALLAAGCGGNDQDSPMSDVPLGGEDERTQGTLVAALGDSIVAGSPLWDPNPDIRERIGDSLDPESQFEHWAELRMPDVRFRNCGFPGQRTDEIAKRLETCAEGAEVLLVQGGINDIGQMRPVSVVASNLRGMVARGKQLGLRVGLVELLPWNNGGAAAAPRVRRLNRLIGEIGRDEKVPVSPWYRRLEDPRAPGRMKPEWTIDGDHPSVEGYRRLAEVLELP